MNITKERKEILIKLVLKEVKNCKNGCTANYFMNKIYYKDINQKPNYKTIRDILEKLVLNGNIIKFNYSYLTIFKWRDKK